MNKTALFWEYRISMVFLFTFLWFFLPMRHKKSVRVGILFASYWITTCMDAVLFQIDDSRVVLVTGIMLLEIVVVQGTAMLLAKYRDFRTLFVGFSSATYVLFGNIGSSAVYIRTGSYWEAMAGQVTIHLLTLGILVWKIRGEMREALEEESVNWFHLCLIPGLFYATVYVLAMWPQDIYKVPGNLAGIILILVTLESCYPLMFSVIGKHRREHELSANLARLELYAKHLRDQSEQYQENEKKVSIMRHDLRHYMTMIRAYLDAGDTESIRELIAEFDKRIGEATSVKYCENLALNGVIATCAREAEQAGISFCAEVDVSKEPIVSEYEFAAVVSNLLENAIHAAGEVKSGKREADLKLRETKRRLILEVSNTYSGELKISDRTGLPETSQGKKHGYGLRSVLAFAKKTGAVFDYSLEDGRFYVRLLVGADGGGSSETDA